MSDSGLVQGLYDTSYVTEQLDHVSLVQHCAVIDQSSHTLLLKVLENYTDVL